MGNTQSIQLKRERRHIIGKGSFGVVYSGTYGGKPAAIKIINQHQLPEKRRDKVIGSEMILLVKQLKHPNVIELLGYQTSEPPNEHEIFIAMELCQDCLDTYLKKITSLSEGQIMDILCQCARGLSFLHGQRLAHRDVKPNNFLIKLSNSDITVKVTDFSLSRDVSIQENATMLSVHGNPNWLAPELLQESDDPGLWDARVQEIEQNGDQIFKSDVFAFALVIIYACVNKEARERMCNKFNVGKEVKAGENVLEYFRGQWISDEMYRHLQPLLTEMLSLDPQRRPSMTDIVKFFGPAMSTSAPRLNLITSHRLGFGADRLVGISPNDGCVLIGRQDPHSLVLYHLQATTFSQLWEKPCPPGVTWQDRKYISGLPENLIITIRNQHGHDPTVCTDGQLRFQHDHHANKQMKLIEVLGSIGQCCLVYKEQTPAGWIIHLHNSIDSSTLCLKPPSDTQWWNNLSICHEESSGWMAVTEGGSLSLCIYDGAGELRHQKKLPYAPHMFNAVSCTIDHILVSQNVGTLVHIHAWDGQHLGSVDLNKKLTLVSGELWVRALGVFDNGRKLMAVLGTYGSVTSMHVFSFEY